MTLFDFLFRFSSCDGKASVYGISIDALRADSVAEHYKKEIIQGDLDALFAYALYESVQDDATRSASATGPMFEMAALHGHVGAQVFMGRMYESGSGVVQDDKKAVEFLKLAAAQGDQDAQYHLGLMHAAGRGGLMASDAQAFRYFSLSTDQGNAAAQLALGEMYALGDEVAQDYQKAMTYFLLSADQGNPDAMEWIGQLYACGQGVAQSDDQAQLYYQKSAEQKELRARYVSPLERQVSHPVESDTANAGLLRRIQAIIGAR